MHRAKSIFITSATTFWIVNSVLGFTKGLSNQGWHFGLILTAMIPVLFLIRLFVFKTPRTSRNLWFITALVFFGVCWGIWHFMVSESHWIFMVLSMINFALWIIYIYWYSFLPKISSNEIRLGQQMPELILLDQNGKSISSKVFGGKKLIYLFYRGNWCPLCMAQIKEISKQYQRINKLGVEVLLISPQPQQHTINLANKMNVPFLFLTDIDNTSAKQLGIYASGGTPFGMEIFGYDSDTVLPTVIIADESGKIIYFDQTDNYRIRPDPDTFLSIIDNNKESNLSQKNILSSNPMIL